MTVVAKKEPEIRVQGDQLSVQRARCLHTPLGLSGRSLLLLSKGLRVNPTPYQYENQETRRSVSVAS